MRVERRARSHWPRRSSIDAGSPGRRVRPPERDVDTLAHETHCLGVGEVFGHPIGDAGPIVLVQLERDGGEARSAQARHDVGPAEGDPQRAGDGHQRGIAGRVAAPLVQLGQPAHVDDET